MLLWLSSRRWKLRIGDVLPGEGLVDLASKVADLSNVSAAPFAGSIIGALFLKRFVTATPTWLHVDLYAWNAKERPGRPIGAEAQGVRALYRLIRERYG